MPTPDRTSVDDIVRTGRDILESDGLQRLTMQAVAQGVGVRAPSLYKRVAGRDDLVRLIASAIVLDLAAHLDAALAPSKDDPRHALIALAKSFRSFAHRFPRSYALAFASTDEAQRPDRATLAEASRAVLDVATRLVGPEHALEAARTVTAWTHGFVSMELAGAFQLGGDIDQAFEFGAQRLADALAAP